MPSTAHPRITLEPGKCGGKPCIRGMRIRVSDVLELLVNGASVEEILADYPCLERDDILAAIAYAAQQTNHVVVEVARGFWLTTSCLLPWPVGSVTVGTTQSTFSTAACTFSMTALSRGRRSPTHRSLSARMKTFSISQTNCVTQGDLLWLCRQAALTAERRGACMTTTPLKDHLGTIDGCGTSSRSQQRSCRMCRHHRQVPCM